jgi:hypothetical protein
MFAFMDKKIGFRFHKPKTDIFVVKKNYSLRNFEQREIRLQFHETRNLDAHIAGETKLVYFEFVNKKYSYSSSWTKQN